MSMQSLTAVDLDDDVEIGRRVHELMWVRRVRGVTLAAAIGVNQSGLSKKLRGERGWSVTNLRHAAATLETTIAYLVGEVGDPDWCTPRDLNPEPTGQSRPSIPQDSGEDRLAPVISIEDAPRFRQLAAIA